MTEDEALRYVRVAMIEGLTTDAIDHEQMTRVTQVMIELDECLPVAGLSGVELAVVAVAAAFALPAQEA